MEVTGILVKTPKGVVEIQTRVNRLAQKKRNLLILVDGNSSVDAMVTRLPSLGDVRQTLQELVDEGYAEFKGMAVAAAPSTTEAEGASFDEAAHALTRALYDLIGPAADDFAGGLKGARDRAGFLRANHNSVLIVENLAGKDKAEKFQQQAIAIADRFFK